MKLENMSPKRKAREKKMWLKIFIASLVPVAVSMYFGWYGAFLVFFVLAFLAYMGYENFAPDENYGPTPWWYFGL